MSHVRPDSKPAKWRKSNCKKGFHDFGATQNIGAGISRRVCGRCAAVTIDLTNTYELAYPIRSTHPAISSMSARDS